MEVQVQKLPTNEKVNIFATPRGCHIEFPKAGHKDINAIKVLVTSIGPFSTMSRKVFQIQVLSRAHLLECGKFRPPRSIGATIGGANSLRGLENNDDRRCCGADCEQTEEQVGAGVECAVSVKRPPCRRPSVQHLPRSNFYCLHCKLQSRNLPLQQAKSLRPQNQSLALHAYIAVMFVSWPGASLLFRS